MTCDRALDALTTGGPLQRWRAARHLARCPVCSGRAEALRRIVEALADVPPLSQSDRQAWMKAADSEAESSSPARPPFSMARRLAIAASLLAIVPLGYWLATRPVERGSSAIVAVVDPALVKRATLRDLDTLQSGASTLSRDLDDLLREVDLLDARRDVEALQLQFASLGERRGP